jgi:hypothetical protein
LSLGDALRLAPSLDQRAGNAALTELDRERNANRPAADDDDLMSLVRDYYSGSVIASAATQSSLVRENWIASSLRSSQ